MTGSDPPTAQDNNLSDFQHISLVLPTDKGEILRYYHNLGFSLIPVNDRKEPLIQWKDFEKQKPNWEQIQEWNKKFNKPNFAVICGSISQNLIVLDFENEKDAIVFFGNDKFEKLKEKILVIGTPHGGIHIPLIAKGKVPRRQTKIFGHEHPVDLLGDGGYSLLPGSVLDHSKCKPEKNCDHKSIGEYKIISTSTDILEAEDIENFIKERAKILGWKVKLTKEENKENDEGIDKIIDYLKTKDRKFSKVFEGNFKEYDYPSRSEAEQYLLVKLVSLGFSDEVINKIMLKSKTGKWAEESEAYRKLSLNNARTYYVNSKLVRQDPQEEKTPEKMETEQKEKKCNSDNCNLENAKIVFTTSFDSKGEHYEQVRNGFATVTEDDRIIIYSHFHTGEYIKIGKSPKDETQVKLEIVYFPLENDQTRTGQIILPQKPERYIGISGIIDEIESLTQKWLYISPEEWPIFRVQVRITVASWFLFVYDDIKIMERVAGLLAIVGTSGGGKKRWLTVLRQFAYRPIYLLNTTKIPSVFRMAEPWGTPTLLIDEADLKETGSEAEWVQFINSRYDGTPIPRYNTSGEKVETFKSFGLTCLALRRMPKDEGTTGRMIKINATISPIVLPEVAGDDIFEEFEPIRNKLLYLRLKYYNKLKFVGHSDLPADQSWRGKETLTLFRILQQIDPRISQDINKISQDLTEREVQNLSQTWDGLIINEIYAFITDDTSEYKKRKNGYYYFREWTDREGETHTIFLNLKYLADRLGTSASEIQRSMTQFKITTYERFRPDGTDRAQRGILMFGYPQDTDRIFRRYVPGYSGELLKLCVDKQETLAHDGYGNTPNGGPFQTSVPSVPVVPPHDPPNDLSNNNNYTHVNGTNGTSGTNILNLDLGNQKLEQKSTSPDDNHDWDYFRVTDTFDSYLFRKKKRYSKGNVIKFPIVEAPKYIEKGFLAPACPSGYAWDELEKTCVKIQGGGKNGNN